MTKFKVQVSWKDVKEKKEPYHIYENIIAVLVHPMYVYLSRNEEESIQINNDEYTSFRVEKME